MGSSLMCRCDCRASNVEVTSKIIINLANNDANRSKYVD